LSGIFGITPSPHHPKSPLIACLGRYWFKSSLSALLPILIGLLAGDCLGKRISQQVFDRAILVLLAALGCKMLLDAFFL
jgi:uncharacterized membrane protein YfcA